MLLAVDIGNTNTVIGLRLSRDSRASAMGIAVGVLMGSQALGAAMGGVAASMVGEPRAIGGALAAAAVFCLWSAVTTPTEAKHLARRPRRIEADPVFGKLQIYDAWDNPYICVEPVTNANDGFNRAALDVPSHAVVVLEPGRSLAGSITIAAHQESETRP